jgi:hypothetical protein
MLDGGARKHRVLYGSSVWLLESHMLFCSIHFLWICLFRDIFIYLLIGHSTPFCVLCSCP